METTTMNISILQIGQSDFSNVKAAQSALAAIHVVVLTMIKLNRRGSRFCSLINGDCCQFSSFGILYVICSAAWCCKLCISNFVIVSSTMNIASSDSSPLNKRIDQVVKQLDTQRKGMPKDKQSLIQYLTNLPSFHSATASTKAINRFGIDVHQTTIKTGFISKRQSITQ